MVTRMSAQASAERRLSDLDITLPPSPIPFGAYVEATKIGNLLFLSGMLPVIGTNRNTSDASVARCRRRTGERRRRWLVSMPYPGRTRIWAGLTR